MEASICSCMEAYFGPQFWNIRSSKVRSFTGLFTSHETNTAKSLLAFAYL